MSVNRLDPVEAHMDVDYGLQIIVILNSQTDQTKMILRYWMPYIQHTLFELLSSSSFSPHPLLSFSTAHPSRNPREDRFTLLAKSIVYQILSALAYLHDPRRRIAHRDIKPCNILLTGEGLVQVIDFGIAWKGMDGGKQMDGKDALDDDLWPETEEKMYFEVATG
jgi:serine/threonine protein kinase